MAQLRRGIIKSYPAKFLNKKDFDESRALMFEKLSPDILHNDTIIIIEGFEDFVHRTYYVRIYESNRGRGRYRYYVARSSIKEGKVYVDSLVLYPYPTVPDKIMDMAREGELAEIKRRGDATTLTPAARLIINIGVKNKEKNKFDFTTLTTSEFVYED